MPLAQDCTCVTLPAAGRTVTTLTGYLAGNAVFNLRDFGAKGDARVVAGGTIAAGTANLSVASPTFANGDVGKAISVAGAGPAGTTLVTTIAGYVSATAVTLAANASTGVVGSASVAFGTDDTAAARAALGAAAATSGSVVVPAGGPYLLTDQLTVPTGVTVQADGATLMWTSYGSGTPADTAAYAATGNAIRLLSRSRWRGGILQLHGCATGAGRLSPAYSGAFDCLAVIGHFNSWTVAPASFGTFTEDVVLAPQRIVVSGATTWNNLIAVHGATRNVHVGRLEVDLSAATSLADSALFEASWGGDAGLTYHPHGIQIDGLRAVATVDGARTSFLRGVHVTGAYDVSIGTLDLEGFKYPMTWYIGDPGDPGETGGSTAGVPNDAQAGRICSNLTLQRMSAENFDIGYRVLGDADGSTHRERRAHSVRATVRSLRLRGQGAAPGEGGWPSNIGVYCARAHDWVIEQPDISEVYDAISIQGPAVPVSLASLTSASGVAMATTASAHGYVVGQVVIVGGATQPEYNGTVTITGVPSSTSFTYAVAGAPASTATGTPAVSLFAPSANWTIRGGSIRATRRHGISAGDVDGATIEGVRLYDLNRIGGGSGCGIQFSGRGNRILYNRIGRSDGIQESLQKAIQINAAVPESFGMSQTPAGNVISGNHFYSLFPGGVRIAAASGAYFVDDMSTADGP